MTTEVDVNGRNMEVTEKVREYATKKASKLDRYLSGIEEARIDLGYVKSARNAADRHVAQITVHGRGFILRSEERAENILSALDAAFDKIQRRIERYKGKHQRGRGRGETDAAEVPTDIETEERDELAPVIVRRKRFMLVPMDEMEAIEQMSLLGHESFFVFYNVNTNSMNVLYRRRDGTFGLIEPEVG